MKNLKLKVLFFSLLMSILITGSVFAQHYYAVRAAGRPAVKVSLAGTVARENQTINVEKAGPLSPGEILSWTINSVNGGTAPARNYKTIGEIPAGTEYVSGSATAQGNVEISYSVDGGKTFDPKPTILQKQPDGTVKKIPAPAAQYTQVRYEWSNPLNEGNQISAFYQVRVK